MLAITEQEFHRFETHYWFQRQLDPTLTMGRAFVEHYDLDDPELWLTRNDDAALTIIQARYAKLNYWTDQWTRPNTRT